LAHVARASTSAAEIERARDAALRELWRRSYLWDHVAGRIRGLPVYTGLTELPASVGFFSIGWWVVLWLGAGLALAVGIGFGFVAGVVTLGVAWAAVIVAQFVAWRRHRALRRSGRCLVCGYDLAGVARAVDPGLTPGVDLGPARCHECGRGWPLIPGPDGTADGGEAHRDPVPVGPGPG
jgi:hypothetical protein